MRRSTRYVLIIAFLTAALTGGAFTVPATAAADTEATPYDYCKDPEQEENPGEQEDSRKQERKVSEQTPPRFSGSRLMSPTQRVTRALDGCTVYRPKAFSDSFGVMLVPVNFDDAEIDKTAREYRTLLERVFAGFDVSFAHINCSVPVDITIVDEGDSTRINLGQAREVKRVLALSDIHLNAILFMANEGTHFGGAYIDDRVAVFPVGAPASYYIANHEVAHLFTLGDGYRDSYDFPDDFSLNASELFLSIQELHPDVRRAYDELRPPIEQIGVCGGRPIYTFQDEEGVRNIMRDGASSISNKEFLELLRADTPFFSDLQVLIMKNFIADQIAEK